MGVHSRNRTISQYDDSKKVIESLGLTITLIVYVKTMWLSSLNKHKLTLINYWIVTLKSCSVLIFQV